MSRIGRQPVPVPAGVKVSVNGQMLNVEGPKGKLELTVHPAISVSLAEGGKELNVTRSNDERESRALHGLMRALVNNMVVGVSAGYTKKLEIQGVGYQAQLKGKQLALQVGYANQIVLEPPSTVNVTLTDPTHIVITGPDKQAVGQFAAVVRKSRPPEPYKGKGIRYEGEVVRRKAGKAFGSK
jgi:large subunit ribosomal protein L6